MAAAMREFGGPGLEKLELIAAGPQVGVRETRRVKGLYLLTEEDAKRGAQVRRSRSPGAAASWTSASCATSG